MIDSMTAFAAHSISGEWGALRWELRSVNHRYLDFFFKIPDTFSDCEYALRTVGKKILHRGKVECQLYYEPSKTNSTAIEVDIHRAKEIISHVEMIEHLMQQPAKTAPIEILSWPGVIQSKEQDASIAKDSILQSFQEALEKLKVVRQQEGNALKDIMLSKIADFETYHTTVKQEYPEALALQKEKLLNKIKELKVEVDSGRLEQEYLYYAQKSDIAEEIDRLGLQLVEVKEVLAKGGVVGRRMDFLMQEMNREANTLAAKSLNNNISKAAVEMKVIIEQIREQVQNLE